MKLDYEIADIRKLYDAAGSDGKDVLCKLFGEEAFKNITERVKTYEDACKVLGIKPVNFDYLPESNRRRVSAMLKLETIVEALNEGWKPKFDGNTWHYWPWFWLYTNAEVARMSEEEKKERNLRPIDSGVYFGGDANYGAICGFAFAHSNLAPSYTHASVGSRLCLKSEELAVYCGKQFIDLWMDFHLS